ncbi:MAG: hypothetical protein R3F54_30080 [Alphaproteobacteria bacterium]
MKIDDKRILTGGSSGIGLELARSTFPAARLGPAARGPGRCR